MGSGGEGQRGTRQKEHRGCFHLGVIYFGQDQVKHSPDAWLCVAESHLSSNYLAQDLVQINCQSQIQVAFSKGTNAATEIKFS